MIVAKPSQNLAIEEFSIYHYSFYFRSKSKWRLTKAQMCL